MYQGAGRGGGERIDVEFCSLRLKDLLHFLSKSAMLFDEGASSSVRLFASFCDEKPPLQTIFSEFGLSGCLALSRDPQQLAVRSLKLQIGQKIFVSITEIAEQWDTGLKMAVAYPAQAYGIACPARYNQLYMRPKQH